MKVQGEISGYVPSSLTGGANRPRAVPGRGSWRYAAAATLLLATAGCATRPETPALETFDPGGGYRFANLAVPGKNDVNSEDLFVILSMSGGGMRAAALAYGMLEQMRDRRIVWNGQEKSLLDELDVIAGTSTGGLVAAYYAGFGDRIFEEFPERFLYRDISLEMKLRVANPYNLARIFSPLFGRTDLAAEYYDDALFHGLTYGDLLANGRRPYLVIGATDLAQGWSFPFTQTRFDAICADLSRMTLARAVASSSAFPVLFSAVTMENRAGQCGYRESRDYAELESWLGRPDDDRRRKRRLEVIQSYGDRALRRYLRLQDGGLTDNLGIRTALEAMEYGQGSWSLPARLKGGAIRKLIVISVDAGVTGNFCDETQPDDPSLGCDIWAGTAPPVNNPLLDTPVILENWLAEVGYPAGPPDSYVVHTGFRDLALADRKRFDSLPTDLYLAPDDIDALRRVAGDLLGGSANFGRFVADLAEPAIAMSP